MGTRRRAFPKDKSYPEEAIKLESGMGCIWCHAVHDFSINSNFVDPGS